jgi:hypothetical protein
MGASELGEVTIDPRFRGPPDSANGGYACAMVAQFIEGPTEVTLRRPPPLGRPLVAREQDSEIVLSDGGAIVASARSTTIDPNVPEPVSIEMARTASERYGWSEDHPYPTCFVCGPDREAGDGLRIFPGPIDDRPLHAAPWVPEQQLVGTSGWVRDEFVWAALDCPSGIVTDRFGDVGLILLGRLAVEIKRPVAAGAPYVIMAWPIQRDGRKLNTGSALFSAEGELHAAARAVWIEVGASA